MFLFVDVSKTSLELWHYTSVRMINYKIITYKESVLDKYKYSAALDSLWETCR